MAQKFSENYKTATIITAEYHLGYYREIIAIEKRMSSKLGCELYTEISGEKYQIYSGLFRGCLKSLVMKLPPNAVLSIDHSLPVESGKGVIWINVKENILFCADAMDAPRESIYLVSNINGKNFQTNVYDIDDTLDALKELKDNFTQMG